MMRLRRDVPMALAVIWALVMLVLSQGACSVLEEEDPEGRFIVLYSQGFDSSQWITVIRDRQTGREYLWVQGYEKGGLTVLAGSLEDGE